MAHHMHPKMNFFSLKLHGLSKCFYLHTVFCAIQWKDNHHNGLNPQGARYCDAPVSRPLPPARHHKKEERVPLAFADSFRDQHHRLTHPHAESSSSCILQQGSKTPPCTASSADKSTGCGQNQTTVTLAIRMTTFCRLHTLESSSSLLFLSIRIRARKGTPLIPPDQRNLFNLGSTRTCSTIQPVHSSQDSRMERITSLNRCCNIRPGCA